MTQASPDVTKIAEALRGATSSGVRNLNYRMNGNSVAITGEADTIGAKQQAFKAVTAAVGDIGVINAIEVRQAPAATPAGRVSPPAAATPAANVIRPADTGRGDADAILEAKAREHGGKLDWKHSIVDLMKLLGMDSSLEARKKLAGQLGFKGDTGDSATMNIWLHGELMKKVTAGDGTLPKIS